MNIVVIGSCTDSSNLAKELNKRLSNSIVARMDALRGIKNILLEPLQIRDTTNLGAYIGDVESYDISKLSDEQKATIEKSILDVMSVTKKVASSNAKANTGRKHFYVSTFDALTNSFPSGTYSFVKVYSGFVNDLIVESSLQDPSFVENAIFVKITTPKNPLLPVSISDANISKIKEKSFSYIECNSVEDVFKTDLFNLLFQDEVKTETKVEVKKEEKTTETHTVTVLDMAA